MHYRPADFYEKNGVLLRRGETVVSIDPERKTVALQSGEKVAYDKLLVAAGSRPFVPPMEGLETVQNKFSFMKFDDALALERAICKDSRVLVVGGGNTAAEDALYLEKFASSVTLIHRRDALRADAILAKRIAESTVKVAWDSVVTQLNGENKLSSVTLKNVKTGELSDLPVSGLFVAVGQTPATEGLKGVELDGGYIVTDEEMHTSLPGVFAAGDVRKKTLRQVVTATADGAIAAESAIKFLNTNA